MTFEHVTPEWLKEQLKDHKIRQQDLVNAIDSDKATVSKWINGKIPMGGMAKAAIHYYFISLSQTRE